MQSTFRFTLVALAATVLTACASAPDTNANAAGGAISAPSTKPKLVVFLVVDGLPQRQVVGYRDQLQPDGFARFLDRGAWFSDAHYAHAFTVTAAGHATMLTGAYPHRTGIIGNEWKDPATGKEVYNTGDTSFTYIGHKTNALDGTSPKNLKVETVGDVLKRVDKRSVVIGISGKDRGAILPAGKTGTAYMYMSDDGTFASSTFYMKEHPAWVDAFNAAKPADRFFKQYWRAMLPEDAYAKSIPDEQPWFADKTAKLPMMMGNAADEKPGSKFYGGLLRGPYADALDLEFGLAAVEGEKLGQDDAPDILSISLSGHDYVNHAFSAESRLSHDHFLQLDRLLQGFFRDLDARVGKDNWVAVLTADHGFMPAPEFSKTKGIEAGKINSGQALARVNAGLVQKFGEGKWVMAYSSASLLLDKQLMAQKGIQLDAVADEARRLLLLEPGFETAYTRKELLANSRAGALYFESSRKSWHPEVSGEVQFTLKPNYMFNSNSAATHGSPHEYDNHVPILVYGPKWVKAGRIDSRVEVVDIAPTLSRMLGVAAPFAAEGKPLPLIAP